MHSIGLVVRRVMAIHSTNCLFTHPDKPGDFPRRHTHLEKPRHAGVAKHVRRDIISEPSIFANGSPASAKLPDLQPIILTDDRHARRHIAFAPPTQPGQEFGVDSRRRLSFFDCTSPQPARVSVWDRRSKCPPPLLGTHPIASIAPDRVPLRRPIRIRRFTCSVRRAAQSNLAASERVSQRCLAAGFGGSVTVGTADSGPCSLW